MNEILTLSLEKTVCTFLYTIAKNGTAYSLAILFLGINSKELRQGSPSHMCPSNS